MLARAKRLRLPTLLTLLLALASAARADDAAGAMKVAYLDGAATAASAGAAPHPLTQGSALQEGDTVQTSEGTKLEIALASGTLLRIGGGTRLELHVAPVAGGKFSARLSIGNLWAKVHKLLAGDEFKIETENGVAGVRGTEFRVEAAPGKDDLVRVYEGAVEVSDRAGAWSHRLEPGKELGFHKGTAPVGPKAFDAAGEASHPLMRWVRERPMPSGQAGRIHDPPDKKEREKHEKHKRQKQ